MPDGKDYSIKLCPVLGDEDISSSLDQTNTTGGDAPGIFLLFTKEDWPDGAALNRFAAHMADTFVTMDPLSASLSRPVDVDELGVQSAIEQPHQPVWVELLRHGLTFELAGLAPFQLPDPSAPHHSFDYSRPIDLDRFRPVQLRPGSHIAGGANSLPIVRCMMEIARDLVQFFDGIEAVVWPPSSSIIGRRYFDSSISTWLDDGAFPALGLIAFCEGEGGFIESQGLEFFIGHELQIEPALGGDMLVSERLHERLVNQLILSGGIEASAAIIAPDGRRLVLTPSADGRIIHVGQS